MGDDPRIPVTLALLEAVEPHQTAIRLKAYWVRDEANGDHGEPIPVGGFPGSPRDV